MNKYISLAIGLLSFLVVIGFSVHVNYQIGVFNWGESNRYLSLYLSKQPVLTKLYDYRQNDIVSLYRPRELGNFFNLVDAYLLVFLSGIGFTNLLSPLHYISVGIIACFPLLLFLKKKSFSITWLIAGIFLGIVYLTSPAIFLSTVYFRTSKVMVALQCVIFTVLLYSVDREPSKKRAASVYFILPLVLSFSLGITDELGVVMAVLFFLYTIWNVMRGWKMGKVMALGALTGMVAVFLYRQVISPFITTMVTGSQPALWGDASLTNLKVEDVWQGFIILLHYLGYLIGGAPELVVVGVIIGSSFVMLHSLLRDAKTHARSYFLLSNQIVLSIVILLGCTAVLVFLSVIMAVMIHNHSFLVLQSLQLIYYPIPFVTLWFIILSLVLLYIVERNPHAAILFIGVFVGVITINVLKISQYTDILYSPQENSRYVKAAFPVIEAINAKNIDASTINGILGNETIYEFRSLLSRQ